MNILRGAALAGAIGTAVFAGVIIPNKLIADKTDPNGEVAVDTVTVYSIQVAAFSTANAAEAHQATLLPNYSNVTIRDTGEGPLPYKVSVGRFSTYTEAWVQRELLGLDNGPFIVNWEESTATLDASLFTTAASGSLSLGAAASEADEDLAPLFQAAGIERQPLSESAPAVSLSMESISAETLSSSATTSFDADQLFTIGRDAPRNPEGVPALEAFLDEFPQDARANTARLALARRLMGRRNLASGPTHLAAAADHLEDVRLSSTVAAEVQLARLFEAYIPLYQSDLPAASQAFKALADDSTLPRSIRVDALRRHAGVAHTLRDYPSAWDSFDRLARESASAAIRADSRMQLAGLAFELTANGKGHWPEVRMLCQQIFQDETVPKATRATAELMHLETYFLEENHAEVVSLATNFLTTYDDIPREWHVAKYLLGVSTYRIGQPVAARPHLAHVAGQELPRADRFANSEPVRNSLIWLVFIDNELGDEENALLWAARLWDEYPDSEQAARAETFLGMNRNQVISGGTTE